MTTRGLGTIGAVTTVAVLAARVIAAAEEARDPDRYKVIVDRAPFCASAIAAAAAQPNFATRFAFVGVVSITEDDRPLAIIQDKEQNNRIYFKAEGEMIDNVKVVKIEQSEQQTPSKLILRQGLEDATLSYQARAGGPQPGGPIMGMAQPTPGSVAPGTAATVAPGFARTQPTPRRIPFRRGGTE
jgi:hypothetical protein